MSSVELSFPRPAPAVAATSSTASATRSHPEQAPADRSAATPPAAEAPVPSLASLLDQARAAQAELAGQPLPITNHHHRFLTSLFGG